MTRNRVLLFFLPLAFVGTFLLFMFECGGSYLFALHLENQWHAAKPETRQEMEGILYFYSQSEVPTSASEWGNDYVLKKGETMIQYMLLWREPLEVVYDANDRIVVRYTSYE